MNVPASTPTTPKMVATTIPATGNASSSGADVVGSDAEVVADVVDSSSKAVSQKRPVNPDGQLHVYPTAASTQVAPL